MPHKLTVNDRQYACSTAMATRLRDLSNACIIESVDSIMLSAFPGAQGVLSVCRLLSAFPGVCCVLSVCRLLSAFPGAQCVLSVCRTISGNRIMNVCRELKLLLKFGGIESVYGNEDELCTLICHCTNMCLTAFPCCHRPIYIQTPIVHCLH